MKLRVLLLCLLAALAPAAEAGADALARAQMAAMAGSERLRQFTLGQAMLERRGDARVRHALRGTLEQSGFYHDGARPALISRRLSWSPVLAWDANINGGFLNDTFDIYGLSFEVDPAHRALAGVVTGGRVSGDLRLAYGEGRFLDLRGSIEAVYSPRHDIGRGQAGFEACARNHLQGWTFADLCVTGARSWRTLSDSTTASASARVAHLVAAGQSEHELSAGVTRFYQAEGEQNALVLGWSAIWNHAVTDLDLTFAEPIAGETAMRQRISAQVSWRWNETPVSLAVWQQSSDGGMLLGTAREDQVRGLSVSVRPRPQMTVELVHQVTQSSINLFDESRTGLNVRFTLGR